MVYNLDSLESADNPLVLFRGIVGSRAYGTQNANSDTDVRGIFVVPSAEYARLAQPPKQVSDERNDRASATTSRFDCDYNGAPCEALYEFVCAFNVVQVRQNLPATASAIDYFDTFLTVAPRAFNCCLARPLNHCGWRRRQDGTPCRRK